MVVATPQFKGCDGTEQTHGDRGAAAGVAAAPPGGTAGAAPASAAAGGTPVRELFGRLADGTKVYRWSLENGGTRLKVLSYGGILQSLEIPDRRGHRGNVVLGFGVIGGYVARTPYFGALIGRYGNRIGKGRFTLDGTTFQLSVNDGVSSWHGGPAGRWRSSGCGRSAGRAGRRCARARP